MRNLVLFLLFVTINLSAFANVTGPTPRFNKPTPEQKKFIRAKIVKLLGETRFEFTKNVNATLDLLVNRKGELIVLDVETNSTDKSIKDYVISKLNYKKVNKALKNEVTLYKIPLKVVVK